MGCFESKASVYIATPELAEFSELFDLLALKGKDVTKLHNVFKKIDDDNSGELSLVELLDHMKIERTEFSKRVFSIFDEDGSGEIDFREFVLALWNYCTLTKPALIIFAFDLYDRDGSGTMSVEEMQVMCKDVYGPSYKKNRLACDIIRKLEKMNSALDSVGEVDIARFARFCESHPGLLYPAFSFQTALQTSVLGKSFWSNMCKRRLKLSDGAEVPIEVILKSHLDEKIFNKLIRHDQNKRSGVVEETRADDDAVKYIDVYKKTGAVAKRKKNWNSAKTKVKTAVLLSKQGKGFGDLGKEAVNKNAKRPKKERIPERNTEARQKRHKELLAKSEAGKRQLN